MFRNSGYALIARRHLPAFLLTFITIWLGLVAIVMATPVSAVERVSVPVTGADGQTRTLERSVPAERLSGPRVPSIQSIEFDQDATPEVIFGGGVDNGSFTTDRRNGIELALRGKLRFNESGLPENTFNSNGDGTYSFDAGQAVGQSSQTPVWSFEWSVNTDFAGGSGFALDELSYEMGLDGDPGLGTGFLVFDPVTPDPPGVAFFDHAIGDNTTGNGDGTVATNASEYETLLADNNVAQNSWRYDFFPQDALENFDPEADGQYTVYLSAIDPDTDEVLAHVEIAILVGAAPLEVVVQSVAETGDSPTPSDNDFTRIDKAVQAVTDDSTIILDGVFDWTEANATQSWEDAGYWSLWPADVHWVTITANALGEAVIQGPGDLPDLPLEGVFGALGPNRGWEVSNLTLLDFDLSIGMFHGGGGVTIFEETRIINNHIRMATDVPAEDDNFQNIGIHFSFGDNQLIAGNLIEIPGDGTSDPGGFGIAASVGMQSNTSGGAYEGLVIEDNVIQVLNTQTFEPEFVLGIWENGGAHDRNTTIRNNIFENMDAGNDPALNRQEGFRPHSHSSATAVTRYEGNSVSGANIAYRWLPNGFGGDFSAREPIEFVDNVTIDSHIAVQLESNGAGWFRDNDFSGSVTGMLNLTADSRESDARCNWWGHHSGPGGEGPGVGASVDEDISFEPWNSSLGGDCDGAFSAPENVYVDDDYAGSALGEELGFTLPDTTVVIAVYGYDAFDNIVDGIGAVDADGAVFVASGDYETSGQMLVDRNMSLTGVGDKPVISPDGNITGGQPHQAWLLVEGGTDFMVENVVFDGGGHWVHNGLRSHGNTTIDEVDFRNIQGSLSGSPYAGVAVASFGGDVGGGGGAGAYPPAHLVVSNSSFEQIGRIGVLVKGTESTADIFDNLFTGQGDGDFLDYSVEVGAGGSANISGNMISGNLGVASTDDSRSAGILVTSYFGGLSSAAIEGNTITDNLIGVFVGYGEDDDNDVVILNNDFGNNRYQVDVSYSDIGLITDALVGNTFARAAVVRENPIVVSTIFGLIQDAVDAAGPGDTIEVGSGTYQETLAGFKDGLTLQGAGSDQVIIDAAGSGGSRAFNVSGSPSSHLDSITLQGFTLQNSDAGDFGLKIEFVDNLVLSDILALDNGRTGVDLNTVDSAMLENVRAVGNAGAGIALRNVNDATVDGAETENNAWGGLALWATSAESLSNVAVVNSRFADESAAGVFVQHPGTFSNIEITENEFADNGVGFFIDDQFGAPDATGFTLNFNLITGNLTAGVVNEGDGILNANCNWWGHESGPSGQGVGLGDSVGANVQFQPWNTSTGGNCDGDVPDVAYVDDDYAGMGPGDPVVFNHPELPGPVNATFGVDAFATVPGGLSAVSEGGLVLVAEGQYPGGNLVFDNSQTLIGAGMHATVLGATESGYPSGQLGDLVLETDDVEIAGLQVHGYDALRVNPSIGGVENIVIRDNWLRKSNQHGIVVDGANWRITENIIEEAGQSLPHLGILGGVLDGAEGIFVRGNEVRASATSGMFFTNGSGIVLLNNLIEDNGAWGAVSNSQALMGFSRASSQTDPALEVRTGDSVLFCNQLLGNVDDSPSVMRSTNNAAFASLNAIFADGSIEYTGTGQLDATLNWWETSPQATVDVITEPVLETFDEFLQLCFPTPAPAFDPPWVDPGDPVTLTVTVEKPDALGSGGFDIGLEGIVFDLPLPAEFDGLVLVSDGCGGAALDNGVLEVTGAEMPAGSDQCVIELEFAPSAEGSFAVQSSEFFSLETGLGGLPGQSVLLVGDIDIDLDLEAGVDGSVPTEAGWAHYTSTLTNNADALAENVVFWVDVDGIDQDAFDNGARLQWFNQAAGEWTDFGWGVGRPEFSDREAFFLGRDGQGNVTGFPLGGAGEPDGQHVTPIRANFDNDIYLSTNSVESVDTVRVYAEFDFEIGVFSQPLNLALDIERGVTAPDTPPRWDYFTAELSNIGGAATPDNVVLYVEIDDTDFDAGDALEFWDGTAWQSFGWDAAREVWFFGRDGFGGVSGFPIVPDQVLPLEVRVNFLPDLYDAVISIESFDDTVTGVGGIYAAFMEVLEVLATPATITFEPGDLVQVYDGNVKTVGVTTAPEAGLDVDFVFNPAPPVGAGNYLVMATITDPYFVGSNTATLLIEQGAADVSLLNLVQPYDGGNPLPVTVDTDPAGLTANVTYDGNPAAPGDVGNYSAVATVDDANWTGSASGILQIVPAAATVTLDNLNQTYDGTPREVGADTDPAGLDVIVTYGGSTTAPIDAGSYAVIATVDDPNYEGSASDTLVVAQAEADEILISDLNHVYDGTPKAVSVTTVPAGLPFDVTYDGDSPPPVDAGSYAVGVTITDQNYFGSAGDTMEIAQGEQTIDFPELPDRTVNDSPFTLAATAGSGLAVSFELISGPATLVGDEVTLTGDLGEVVIEAGQPGDANWLTADPVQQAFEVIEGSGDRIEAASDTTISGQSGEPVDAEDLPTVRVLDIADNPVPGVTVSFEIISGGGSTSGATQVTDGDGLAQLGGWMLGSASTQVLHASAPGLTDSPVEFTAIVDAVVDLSISVTNGIETIEPGARMTYIIVVENQGPNDAEEAEVDVPLLSGLSNADWQCIPALGAACESVGTDGISETVELPAGSSLTWILSADVDAGHGTVIELEATVSVENLSVSDSDVTEVVSTVDAIFQDRFEDTGQEGLSVEVGDGPIAGHLQAVAQGFSAGLPPKILLAGMDRAGRDVFRAKLLGFDGSHYVRLSILDTSGNWHRSSWLPSLELGESVLAFEYDAGAGLLLLVGERSEILLSIDPAGQPANAIRTASGEVTGILIDG